MLISLLVTLIVVGLLGGVAPYPQHWRWD